MPHSVSLLFDVEDLCWPDSDDITLELATRLTRHNYRATFFVVGEKAKLFAERGRSDIINALLDHDLASHTTRHSIHPTISEYLAGADWDEGVLQAMEDEGLGLEMLADVFGRAPTSWGQPGGSWGPQINAAMARLNMPVVVYPRTRVGDTADVHWYANALVFPGDALILFDSDLTDDALFEARLQRMIDLLEERIMLGTQWTGIFVCHPTRLRAVEFWDGLNFAKGVDTAPADYKMPTLRDEAAYQTALKNVDRLLEVLQQDRRLQIKAIDDLARTYSPPPETVYLQQIDEAVVQINEEEAIPTGLFNFSPAELLDLMVQAYTGTSFNQVTLKRRTILGPTDEPPLVDPSDESVTWSDFVTASQMVLNHVTYHGRLPSSVYLKGFEWGIGSFYWSAVEAWLPFRHGNPLPTISWKPSSIYPAIGQEIASLVQDDYDSWPIHKPDVDLNKMLMHTCFQCWTLRPAY